jgi:hypothetical protein
MSDSRKDKGDAARGQVRKKRSVWEKCLVWGGILTLLILVLMEWSSKQFYEDALRVLETGVQARDLNGVHKVLPLAEAKAQVRGFTFRSEEGKRPNRRVIYAWPSFFKRYKVVMTLNGNDEVVAIDSQYDPDDDHLRLNQADHSLEAKLFLKERKVTTGEHVVELAAQQERISVQSGGRYGSLFRELVRQAFLVT